MKNTIKAWCVSVHLLSLPIYAEDSYSPAIRSPYPDNVYFGDTHLHTNISSDGNYSGKESLPPDEAYRFAKGEIINAPNGMQVQIGRPLDFLVVSDHAVNMGVMNAALHENPLLQRTEEGRFWLDIYKKEGDPSKLVCRLFHPASLCGDRASNTDKDTDPQFVRDEAFHSSVWQGVGERAERHNNPGKFTAFVGYEWTPSEVRGRGAGNYHRIIVFRDGAKKTNQVIPFSRLDSEDPEALWQFLSGYQQKTGGEVIAIPHNGNASHGEMFALTDLKGNALSKAYALTRQRWEPIYEITQVKGDGETHPVLSPTDEFADFETWNGWYAEDWAKGPLTEKQRSQKPYEYARSALKLGLDQQAKLGVNPFKYGFIGSTDSHIALSAVEEDNFLGKFGRSDYPSADRLKTQARLNAAGYAAVWAEENTRESLFAAMKRRETYATTGPRMTVRFFGGWGYEQDDANRPDLAKIGYAGGVPMGGDLTAAPKGKAPNFIIRAVKDPNGANLDRVQVIKGWRSADGELHEKIYNVALSGSRKDKGTKTKKVGSTVDVREASYTNTIGEAELATMWTDPDFKADELAFYYVRVLEIPTPRWTAHDAKFFGIKDVPDDVPMVTQERAYTSPIWYTP